MNVRLRSHQKIKINSPSDIFSVIQPIFRRSSKLDRDRERAWVFCLDASQTIQHLELIGIGTKNVVLLDPMEVYSLALMKRAASIIVVHNHPSGNLTPSRKDKTATEKFLDASSFLNIKLLDHLIISESDYFSFLDEGIFETLETRKFIMFNSVLAMD